MPLPGEFGKARSQLNIAAPAWILAALKDVQKRELSTTGRLRSLPQILLVLAVEALEKRGYVQPDSPVEDEDAPVVHRRRR